MLLGAPWSKMSTATVDPSEDVVMKQPEDCSEVATPVKPSADKPEEPKQLSVREQCDRLIKVKIKILIALLSY